MPVSEAYSDSGSQTGAKRGYKNGVGFGGKKRTFSNGQAIGDPTSFWDNSALRQAPHIGTPGVDRLSQHLANLGLNGYEQNTSDPSGRAGAAALTKIWGSAMEKVQESMKDVSAAVDEYIAPIAAKVKGEAKAAMKFMDDSGSGRSPKALATLDASFAAQQFGRMGKSKEVEILERIEKQNERGCAMLAANVERIGWIRGG